MGSCWRYKWGVVGGTISKGLWGGGAISREL